MPYIQSKDKLRYQDRLYSIHLGPRGGKYIQMNGGMVSISKIPKTYEETPMLIQEIKKLLKIGIEAIFDVCKDKIKDLRIEDFTNALLLLFRFNATYHPVSKAAQDSCTCTREGWARLEQLNLASVTIPSIHDKRTQYMIACNFADFLRNIKQLNDPRYHFPKVVYENLVEGFIQQNKKPMEYIMTECNTKLSKDFDIEHRVCSWHPMHDYLMTYVLNEMPSHLPRRSTSSIDTTKTFIQPSQSKFSKPKRSVQKSMLTAALRNL